MATVQSTNLTFTPNQPRSGLHRIAQVRKLQGLSLRSAARQMEQDIGKLRHQEDPSTDLTLSELYQWQEFLGVPIDELLEAPHPPLSRPVLDRARLVRVMKTVRALIGSGKPHETKRMAEMLETQLLEIMPELKDVGPWHSVGQRRSLEEYGRTAERTIPEDALFGHR